MQGLNDTKRSVSSVATQDDLQEDIILLKPEPMHYENA
jgi:hypothetical protein